ARTPCSRSMPLRIASISLGSPKPFKTTSAPSLASSFAMPSPMPLVDPVMIATLPFNMGKSFQCLVWGQMTIGHRRSATRLGAARGDAFVGRALGDDGRLGVDGRHGRHARAQQALQAPIVEQDLHR